MERDELKGGGVGVVLGEVGMCAEKATRGSEFDLIYFKEANKQC